MTITSTPSFPQLPKNGHVTVVNADGTTQKTVYTGGANGSKITSLIGTSNDTAAHDVQISITNGGTSYLLGTVSIPIGAGNTSSVPAVNLLDPTKLVGLPLDSDGNPYIHLASASDTLTVAMVVAVTAAKTVWITAPTVADW